MLDILFFICSHVNTHRLASLCVKGSLHHHFHSFFPLYPTGDVALLVAPCRQEV